MLERPIDPEAVPERLLSGFGIALQLDLGRWQRGKVIREERTLLATFETEPAPGREVDLAEQRRGRVVAETWHRTKSIHAMSSDGAARGSSDDPPTRSGYCAGDDDAARLAIGGSGPARPDGR